MILELHDAGKQFFYHWIFKELYYEFRKGGTYAILGANGSGKSTLMKILAGISQPTKGKCFLSKNGKPIDSNQSFQHISFTAPYLELIEEFTLKEMLEFHAKMKPFIDQLKLTDVAQLSGLEKHLGKTLASFSSGMKQRAKLSLAILSQSDFLLLDEPSTALDDEGTEWYRQLLFSYKGERGIIISSNRHKSEYDFCTHWLSLPQLTDKGSNFTI